MTRIKPVPAAPSVQPSDTRHVIFLAAVFFTLAVVCIAHWPVLSASARFIDDDQYFVENPLVRDPGWKSVGRFLVEVLEPSTVEGYYQPLTMISLMLDAAMGATPENLRPFHRTSLILHLANVALVIILLRTLFHDGLAAAAIGLLYGLHPMTVEPIAWVSDRKTLLATLFALTSLICHLRFIRTRGVTAYGLSLAAFALALMAKPTSLMLPLVLVLLDVWPLRRLSGRGLVEKLPFVALAITFGIITYISQARTCAATMPQSYPPERIPLTLAHNIVFYLQQMIWPANASGHFPFPEPMKLSSPAVLRGVIGTALLLGLLPLSLRWTRGFVVSWLVFFVAILPTMQIIGFTDVIASDKYAYWPVIGILLILTRLFACLAPPAKPTLRVAAVALVVVIAAAETYATRQTLAEWRNSETLWQYLIRIEPNDARLRAYYAVFLAGEPGRADDALQQCLETDRVGIRDELVCSNVGSVLIGIGRRADAKALYERSLPMFGQSYSVLSNLGVILLEEGRTEEAAALFKRAIALKPGRAEPYNNLANTYLHEGRLDEAVAQYRASLAVRPDIAETHNNLGVALFQMDRDEESLREFAAASQLRADYADPHRNRALVLASTNRLTDAMTACRTALSLEPNDALNHALMGDLLMSSDRPGDAAGAYRNALRLSPGLPGAERGLAGAEAASGASQPSPGP